MQTPPYELNFSVELITPEQAETWLVSLNVFNRPQKPSLIERLSRDMASGRFKLNGEPIIFASENGQLLDGQNRLAAIVKSNTAIWSVIIRGVPKNCFDTIDGGAPRNLTDYLAIAGESNSRELKQALLVAVTLEKTGAISSGFKPTSMECQDFLDRNPITRSHVERVKGCGKLLLSSGFAAGLLFHFNEIDAALSSQWLEALVRDAASREIVIQERAFQLMRDRLLENLDSRKKIQRADLWCICVTAWNAAANGWEIKRIHLPRKGAELPKIQRRSEKAANL